MNTFKSGSKWRKWDLHLHTPETKLNDQYVSVDGADVWDTFCEKIETSDVAVFGITDYFSAANYFRFLEKFRNKYPDSTKVFFPNIEFRIDSKNHNGDHIQVHVLFSNEKATTDKLANFFTRLKLVSTDDENLTNKYCTETDLASVTYQKAMVKIDALCAALKADFAEEECLIIGLATGYGSLRPASGDGRGAEYAKEIDKICALFFGNRSNTDFFLNKIEGRSQYKLKPKSVITGCDSHSFIVLDKKLGNCFEERDESGEITDYSEVTWIKANPTFEGLRQIIFEPEERICIQELQPDEKELYRVIDKVKLDDPNFTPDPIELNPNLNVIIGSRSSGKTTLLNSIAKAVDYNEFSLRHRDIPLIKEPPKANVFWLDGAESDNKEIQKGITYIPQNYINSLAEATEENSPILEIAENALFDSESSISQKRKELNAKVEQLGRSIGNDVYQLFVLRKQIGEQKDKIKKIGDKKGIEEQIKKIEAEIAKLQKDLTKEEAQSLKDLRELFAQNKKQIEALVSDIQVLTDEASEIEDGSGVFEERLLDLKSEEVSKDIAEFTNGLQKEYLEEYLSFINEKKDALEKKQKELENANKKILDDNKVLIEKSKQNTSAEQKVKEKDAQDKKLAEISNAEKILTGYEDSLTKLLTKIVDSHKSRSEARHLFVAEAKGDLDGIEYLAVVGVDTAKLEKFLSDNINFHHSIGARTKLNLLPGYKTGDEIDATVLIKNENIRTVVELILDDTLKLKAGVDLQRAVEGIFGDFEFVNYSLKYEGDNYPEMTPGKKSLVVLKLLVESSDDKYPILIDQPEDDLDSRSISGEIVEFLRTKKKERQIILVTHNANIAIKADAEEIVVANRHGSQHPNKNNVMFDYATGAIETSFTNLSAPYALDKMGMREHACELLEGGEEAFENRRNKYNLK